MPLVYACIAPHGGEVIEELATKLTVKKFQATREGMRRLAREVKRARPDTIVIASPHNLRLWGRIGVVLANYSSGRLQASPRNKNFVTLKVKCDTEFAEDLVDEGTGKGLPVVGANYGTSDGPASDMPMDWGTLIPLWFFTKGKGSKPKVVIVTPSREIPLRQNFEFGRVIARVAERGRSKKIVFVASADQAHTYKKSGPYGFNRRAPEYDRLVLDAIRNNRLHRILDVDRKLIDQARPDSVWQMAILAGIMDRIPMNGEVFSFQVPTYYGMICAGFKRTNSQAGLR
jgi:aromatic ring-opening dioxygenase LigB subunit